MSGPIWTNTLTTVPNFQNGYKSGVVQFIPIFQNNTTTPSGSITIIQTPDISTFQQGSITTSVVETKFYGNSSNTVFAGDYTFTATLLGTYGLPNTTATITEASFFSTQGDNIQFVSYSYNEGSNELTFTLHVVSDFTTDPTTPTQTFLNFEYPTDDNTDNPDDP